MKSYWSAIWLSGIITSAALVPLASGGQVLKTSNASVSTAISINRVEVARPAQQTLVRIAGGSRLDYHITRLADPPRVVVDFDDARLALDTHATEATYDPVRRVRVGQFRPQQMRLVIDLTRPATYTIQNSNDDLVLAFAGAATSKIAAANSGDSQHIPDANLRVADFSLPLSLTHAMPALAAPKPQESTATASAAPMPAQPNPAPRAPASPVAAAAQAAVVVQGAPAAVPGTKVYTGEPISVNLKDVDLKDFFRLIHEISGLNVVLDPSVRGTVTIVLDEVPWDQALDIVLRNNSLYQQLDGNVLRIASQETVKREADQRAALAKAEADSVETVTSTRVLNYAKASEIVVPLRRFLSPRGEIVAQDRSNMLIIRDVPASMPQIDNLIRQLDRKTQQVEIQARVVQASRSFARDIGTQFGFAASTNQGRNVIGGLAGNSEATSPISHPSSTPPPLVTSGTTSMPLVSNFPAVAPTSGLTFAYGGANFALDYLITAAESKGVGKLLSSPQLVTQNNAQAVVKQGTQVPIQTSVNNTISTQYIDAVLRMQVTPQITAEGTVFLDVTVENTQIDAGIARVNGIPALDTQSAQTKVLINDGGTIVIGGVMVSQQQTSVSQVPLVGSIPIIGHLFKRNAVNVQSQELLFFLTPRILPS